ncbi:MAG: hypothetical protein H0W30_05310 [Gemmatimonadaceae bacterium]|nr:hypothetical protein [Gemmatimonadaceae bacterium]
MPNRNESSPLDSLKSNAGESPQPTVFSVLAAHARGTPSGPLAAATLFGVLDAIMIGRAHPALWWLAAGFVSLAAYGGWGLADRALASGKVGRRRTALSALRATAIALGCAAALAVVLGLMRSALGGWIH